MRCFKYLTGITIAILLLFFKPLFCFADDLIWYEEEKEVIFEMAKEQDKFVLLFVGNHDCPLCQISFGYFNDPAGKLRKIIDDNYITWFVSYYTPGTPQKENLEPIMPYIADYEIHKEAGEKTNFPILAIINPNDPDEDFTFYWGSGARTTKELYDFISAPPDLFAGQKLTWYENKNEVLKLAKEQNKKILKLVGKPTSPNSKTAMQQLNEEPLKQIIEDNFILWFSSNVSEVNIMTFAAEPNLRTLPYITILDPKAPDNILDVAWGDSAIEALREILKSYTVSTDIVNSINHVTVLGNVIHLTNQTENEEIQVFTITGRQVAYLRKNDYTAQIDASSFPEGVLIVCSSTGWSKKIIIR